MSATAVDSIPQCMSIGQKDVLGKILTAYRCLLICEFAQKNPFHRLWHAQTVTSLSAGQSLSVGSTLASSDGQSKLVFQGDGNLVVSARTPSPHDRSI